jgi:Cell wall-active antibiotics response 4TMS YvqF
MSRRLVRLIAAVVVLKGLGHVALALAAVRYKLAAPGLPEPGADEIDLAVIMDASRFASSATAFSGGRITCWYGGTDVDLRDATLAAAGARLEVRTAFGGTRIVVAPDVPVRVHARAVFGGTSNQAGAVEPTAGSPGLEIRGFTVLGALQVIAAEPGAALAAWAADVEARGRGDSDGEAAPDPDGDPA